MDRQPDSRDLMAAIIALAMAIVGGLVIPERWITHPPWANVRCTPTQTGRYLDAN